MVFLQYGLFSREFALRFMGSYFFLLAAELGLMQNQMCMGTHLCHLLFLSNREIVVFDRIVFITVVVIAIKV